MFYFECGMSLTQEPSRQPSTAYADGDIISICCWLINLYYYLKKKKTFWMFAFGYGMSPTQEPSGQPSTAYADSDGGDDEEMFRASRAGAVPTPADTGYSSSSSEDDNARWQVRFTTIAFRV